MPIEKNKLMKELLSGCLWVEGVFEKWIIVSLINQCLLSLLLRNFMVVSNEEIELISFPWYCVFLKSGAFSEEYFKYLKNDFGVYWLASAHHKTVPKMPFKLNFLLHSLFMILSYLHIF